MSDKWTIETLKAYYDLKFAAVRRENKLHRRYSRVALKLQAAETARRLSDLNNETGRVAAVIEKTVSADTYASDQRSFAEFKEKVNSALDDRGGKNKALPVVLGAVSVVISLVAAAAVIVAAVRGVPT